MIDLNLIAEGLSETQGTPLTPTGFAVVGEREDMNDYAEAFNAAVRWLSKLPRPKAKTRWPHSYGLKHRCERATGIFTPNGIIIAAAFAIGIPVTIIDGGPNARIGVSGSTRERGDG